ncbi:MAG: efflux RND transporter periplasmic adaptor subunit [Bacteroidales bacterium]|jgi:HlyD family secretion protein|nr:efflux RND transporter periplasmic adaptor subunit [Bacteroidales bacterium]
MGKANTNKTKKLRRNLIILVSVLIVLAIIGGKANWFGKTTGHQIAVSEIEKRNIVQTVSTNGKIQPETEVKISPDVSGEIVELRIKEGQEVTAGDFLLKIKPDVYESYLERAEASLNSTKANLANSKARLEQVKAQFNQTRLSFDRNEQLYAEGAISLADFENAQAAFEMGKADVNAAEESVNAAEFSVLSAKASVKEASENLRKTVVYAPISGTISMLNVEEGERVVGTEMMAGTEMLRIANLNLMEVVVEVNENDIIKVSLKDTAEIEVDAYLNRIFKGIVTEIANSATNTGLAADQVTNFEVKIRMLPESYKDLQREDNLSPFRPGMSASVDIQTEAVNQVLVAPIQSVTVRVDSSMVSNPQASEKTDETLDIPMKEVVFVYNDGKVEQRNVETGIQDTEFIEIKSGLELSEEVVSAPYSLISKILKNNTTVEKVSVSELYQQKKK